MTAVFHRIGEPSEDHFTNSIEQILDYDGQITFDGAYDSLWKHREKLAEKDPVLFVQGNTVGEEGILSWTQITELDTMGWIIGWHGWTHRRLPELSDQAVIKELTPSNPMFKLYAYPHGDFDERTKKLVEQMGYLRGYSTTQGDDSDFAIRREYI